MILLAHWGCSQPYIAFLTLTPAVKGHRRRAHTTSLRPRRPRLRRSGPRDLSTGWNGGVRQHGIGDIQQRPQAIHMPQVMVVTDPDIPARGLIGHFDAL